ncbi:MAG: hypothetical protein GQ569_03080 [Methylococcaceae bacterium]|nr:hypothetical protein [Methylococcaceae bacterium]
MTERYFVVEGKNDEFVLKQLLPDALLKDTKIIVASGHSSGLSIIQTLFTLTPLPISFFFDADTYSEEKISENTQFIHSYLKKSFDNSFLLFPMKPEMEILFFYKRELLNKLLDNPISDDLWQRSSYEPCKVLMELLECKRRDQLSNFLEKKLTSEIVQELQQNPLINDIVQAHIDTSVVNNNAIAA